MSEVVDVVERDSSLKTVGHISYLLHTLVALGAVLPGAQASLALLVVALVIDLVKRSDAVGTWQESHFGWRIRSVLWAAGLYLLTSPLWVLLVLPGWIAWGVISVWFLYRVVRGWVNLNAGKAMPS